MVPGAVRYVVAAGIRSPCRFFVTATVLLSFLSFSLSLPLSLSHATSSKSCNQSGLCFSIDGPIPPTHRQSPEEKMSGTQDSHVQGGVADTQKAGGQGAPVNSNGDSYIVVKSGSGGGVSMISTSFCSDADFSRIPPPRHPERSSMFCRANASPFLKDIGQTTSNCERTHLSILSKEIVSRQKSLIASSTTVTTIDNRPPFLWFQIVIRLSAFSSFPTGNIQ